VSRSAKLSIFLAEDNRADVVLVREALREHGLDVDLVVKQDGEQMLGLIERVEAKELPCPDMILLDLNIPRRNGLQLLQRLRESAVCANVPVVIVTSSDAPKDRQAVARLNADSYFCKPSGYDEYMRLGAIIKELLGKREPTPGREQ